MSDKPFDMPDAGHTWEERGGWLVNRLAEFFNLQPFQAAGIVGNLGYESAGFTKLHEIGQPEGQGGYGWAQWTGPRRKTFMDYCDLHRLDWRSDEANYGYLFAELRMEYHHTITAVSQTLNDADAVFSVGQTYERPGGTTSTNLPGFDGRLKYARRALVGAGAHTQVGTPTPPVWIPAKPAVSDTVGPVVAAIKGLQTALVAYGYDGRIDGMWGPRSAAALQAYRVKTGK